MALNSLRFRIEGDNSGALRAISQVESKVRNLGGDLQSALGKKMVEIFAVGTIIEAARRTGEWAESLAKAARNAGVGVEEFQALQHAADQAGIDIDKIFNYYDKLQSSAAKAIEGNKKLGKSFETLGITSAKHLKSLAEQGGTALFDAVMKGSGRPGGELAAAQVMGEKRVLNIRALAREMAGRDTAQYTGDNRAQVADKENVGIMAAQWDAIKEDLKASLIVLAPIGTLLLSVVEMITSTIRAIADAFGYIGKTLFKVLPAWAISASRKAVGVDVSGKRSGVGGWAEDTLDAAATENMSRRASNKQALWSFITLGFGGKVKGTSNEEYELGSKQATALTVLPFLGLGAAKNAAQGGAKSMSGAGGTGGRKLIGGGKNRGLLSEGAIDVESTILPQSEWVFADTIGGGAKMGETFAEKAARARAAVGRGASSIGEGLVNGVKSTFGNATGVGPINVANFIKWFRGLSPAIQRKVLLAAMAGKAAGLSMDRVMNSGMYQDITGEEQSGGPAGGLSGNGFGGGSNAGLFGGGSANLGIGGVMGVDLQGKLVDLNSKQCEYLDKIMQYTGKMAGEAGGEETVPN